MNCEEFQTGFSEHLDRRLGEAQEAELALHQKNCPPCQEYARDMQASVLAVRSLRSADVPADFADRVMDAVAKEDLSLPRRRTRWITLGALGSIAALFLVVILIDPFSKKTSVTDEVRMASAEPAEKDRRLGERADEAQVRDQLAAKDTQTQKLNFGADRMLSAEKDKEREKDGAESGDYEEIAQSAKPSNSRNKQDEKVSKNEKDADDSLVSSADLNFFKRQLDSQSHLAGIVPPSGSTQYFVAKASQLDVLRKNVDSVLKPEKSSDGKAEDKLKSELGKEEGRLLGIQAELNDSTNGIPNGAQLLRLSLTEEQAQALLKQLEKTPELQWQSVALVKASPLSGGGASGAGPSTGATAGAPSPSTPSSSGEATARSKKPAAPQPPRKIEWVILFYENPKK